MKFNEALNLGLVPEWREQYVQYKRGKKLIGKIVAATAASDRTPLLLGEQSIRSSLFRRHSNQEFSVWLDLERTKVERFYTAREREVYERFLVLEDQLYQLKEHGQKLARRRRQHGAKSGAALGAIAAAPLSELAYHTRLVLNSLQRYELPSLPRVGRRAVRTADVKMLSQDDLGAGNGTTGGATGGGANGSIGSITGLRGFFARTNSTASLPQISTSTRSAPAMARAQSYRTSTSNTTNDGASINSETASIASTFSDDENYHDGMALDRRTTAPSKDYAPSSIPYFYAKRQLKQAMLEQYRSLMLLRSYREMNRTAFRKICKKYDKQTKSNISTQFMTNLDRNSYFLTSDILDKLVFQVEELYITFFDPKSTDRKQSLEKLKSIAYALAGDIQASFYSEFFTVGMAIGISIPLFTLAIYTGVSRAIESPHPYVYLLQIYGGFFLLTALFVLFGSVLLIFQYYHINYKFIFEFDIGTALDWKQFMVIPSLLLAILAITMWFSMQDFWRKFPSTQWPWIYFGTGLVLFLWPGHQFYPLARRWLRGGVWRLILLGFYPVEFRDFFVGDMVCSLTYTMGNLSFYFCQYSHHWSPNSGCGSDNSRIMGFLAALPTIWRTLQCARRYIDSGDWFPHFANMIKYSIGSAYYALLSVYRIDRSGSNRISFVILAIINSVYTAAWDIVMDWSLLQVGLKNWLLRDHLFYKKPIYYYGAMVADILLRFQWIFYAFFSNQIQQLAVTSFGIACAEIIRRLIWVIFRMENEHVTNVVLFRASRDAPLPYPVSIKVEYAIKRLVGLRYQGRESTTSSGETLDEEMVGMMEPIERKKSALANFSDTLTKAHMKDFQRKRVDEEVEEEVGEEEEEEGEGEED